MRETDSEDALESGAHAVPSRQGLERKAPVRDDTRQGIGQTACEAAQCPVSGRPVGRIEPEGVVPDGARHRIAQKAAEHAQDVVPEGGAQVREGPQTVDCGARQRHSGTRWRRASVGTGNSVATASGRGVRQTDKRIAASDRPSIVLLPPSRSHVGQHDSGYID